MASAEHDLYATLGVSHTASLEELKQRYRQLVRQYHPDVSLDKVAAHHRFVELVDAYKTLADPVRRQEYDEALAAQRRKQQTTPSYSWENELRQQSLDSLITAAELYFIRGQVEKALHQCKEVLKKDKENPHAYGMLGDIYRESGKIDDAILMYTYAAQYAGGTGTVGAAYLRKIEELTRKAPPQEQEEEKVHVAPVYSTSSEPTVGGLIGSLIAVAAVIGTLFYVTGNPGPPAFSAIPRNFLIAAGVDGFLVGLILAWLRWVRHSDAELFSLTITEPGGSGLMPLGFVLGVSGLVFFYASIVAYVAVCYFEEVVSLSVVTVFASTLMLLAILTILCPAGRPYFALGGGNVIFTGMLAGWILGSIGRNPW